MAASWFSVSRIMFLVPQMQVHLAFQRPLQNPSGQLLNKPGLLC
jgi:hypothetical protein